MNRMAHLLAVVWGGWLAMACAPSAQALFIDPLRIEVTAPTGATHTVYISISNDSPHMVTAEAGYYNDTPPQGEWIHAPVARFALAAGAVTSLPYRLEVPADAAGEYRGRAFFAEAEAGEAAGATRLTTRLAVPIYILVRNTETVAVEIQALKVLSAAPLRVAITVFNGGNQHIRPQGTLRLSGGPLGEKSVECQLNPTEEPVFPLSSENLMARSDRITLPFGDYEAWVELRVREQTFTHRAALRIP